MQKEWLLSNEETGFVVREDKHAIPTGDEKCESKLKQLAKRPAS